MIESKTIIEKAQQSGRNDLNDEEGNCILNQYGIPVVPQRVVYSKLSAIEAAEQFGYPVVVKQNIYNTFEKEESSYHHLSNETAVSKAVDQIVKETPDAHILVQPQIEGRREFAVGLLRDLQFGPVVFFGLGGILTEALSDAVFRLAPLSSEDAISMIDSFAFPLLLKDFRGEIGLKRDQLAKILISLSNIAQDFNQIAKIEINPLIATATGELISLNAKVTLAQPENHQIKKDSLSPIEIQSLLHPSSVVFIGASSQFNKWGHSLLCNTISGGYQGSIFLVNSKGEKVTGRNTFKEIIEVPGNIDLAVVTVPAVNVIELIPQLKVKGVKHMLLISSGFSETGIEGKYLEDQLMEKVRQAGILTIGPNSMGLCNPYIDFYCTGIAVRPKKGNTAIVTQSGYLGSQLLAHAEEKGIGVRAFVSSGNEAMISIEDYLEVFEADETTKNIVLYLESIKQGRCFFETSRRISLQKPIVLLKGGQTIRGEKAALSHTGATPSDARLFDSACEQAGIIKVDQPTELLDLAAALSSLPLPRGNRTAILTLGGGWGVIAADLCIKSGLSVPELTPDLVSIIDKMLPPFWSRSNPVDIVGELDPSIPLAILEALLSWEGCDAIINLGIFGRRILVKRLGDAVKKADTSYSREFIESTIEQFSESEAKYAKAIARMMESYAKPVLGVSFLSPPKEATVFGLDESPLKAVFYKTPERAVKALSQMVKYNRYLCQHKR